ncbi:MAG: monovalent cation/H+ antiporter subunit D family protein [Desulfomonilaceae bacterium]|nr:monovalent cation/H+ antiporter subunit D family protein [Desulfomonilaceae bacterium]
MEPLYSIMPLIAVLVSLGVVPILMSSRSANVREAWTFGAAALKFLIVLSMLPTVLEGRVLVCTIAEVLPGVAIRLRVDALGMLFALVASSLWIITSAYSIGYMRGLKEHGQTRYFCFFALALSATIGAAFSANLFTLYLFYEMLSFATYPLVTHHQDAEARRSGRKYLLYIVGTSIGLVLPAMVVAYYLSGTLEFSGHGFLPASSSPILLGVLLFMFLFGFAKAAIMPLHAWLPAAMVAPTPVSALLHAVAVVKVGVFCILRVLTEVFGVELLASLNLGTAVAYVAAFTIIVASLIALTQDELKRLLAFSTIGQLSYIVLGVALLTPKGITGGMVHIAMHAFGKITLFFCAGAIFVATGKKYISQMAGIGKQMPLTMAAFFIGVLSVIGLPPTGGFVSKWYLVLGTLPADQWSMLIVILTSSLLNAAYFFPILYRAFFRQEDQSRNDVAVGEAPLWCLVPLMITAVGCILLFFYPFIFLRLAELAGS